MTDYDPSGGSRRINWLNVLTVCAAILIAAEVFGAAFAGGWALAIPPSASATYGITSCRALFFLVGIAVMVAFIRNAQRVEPFTTRAERVALVVVVARVKKFPARAQNIS